MCGFAVTSRWPSPRWLYPRFFVVIAWTAEKTKTKASNATCMEAYKQKTSISSQIKEDVQMMMRPLIGKQPYLLPVARV